MYKFILELTSLFCNYGFTHLHPRQLGSFSRKFLTFKKKNLKILSKLMNIWMNEWNIKTDYYNNYEASVSLIALPLYSLTNWPEFQTLKTSPGATPDKWLVWKSIQDFPIHTRFCPLFWRMTGAVGGDRDLMLVWCLCDHFSTRHNKVWEVVIMLSQVALQIYLQKLTL